MLNRVPKKGFPKVKEKSAKNVAKKSAQKSFATFKSYENSANKVLFPKKVLKRVPKKRVPKKVQEKVQKMGLKKVQKKVRLLFKVLRKIPKKVFSLQKVQKREL